MFLKQVLISILLGLLSVIPLAQASTETINLDRLTIQVKGIVCSFCAFGVEKNLSKLPFLDKTQFGQNGVLIDINTQEITLALLADKFVAYADIATAIIKGGYDPVSYHGVIEGRIQSSDGTLYLVDQDKEQVYNLPQTAELTDITGKRVLIDITLTAAQAKASNAEEVLVSKFHVSHVYEFSEPRMQYPQAKFRP
ncbi:heavy-metal-associated domain-containing protein [Shewanella psychropiezotolerans]|uniref:Heavy-metal-associated domain-containing protein n=2 Tax=Shewanellaceae TaxID=267890 RepID=A0ABX5X5F7_9GAMM|nr:heavy-metal-associated domain-containing protein [Shewanella sp. YLB-07]QDO86584.1 heavy-metal-associated domain-containing protein [Shewanella psychropiezotolerans]